MQRGYSLPVPPITTVASPFLSPSPSPPPGSGGPAPPAAPDDSLLSTTWPQSAASSNLHAANRSLNSSFTDPDSPRRILGLRHSFISPTTSMSNLPTSAPAAAPLARGASARAVRAPQLVNLRVMYMQAKEQLGAKGSAISAADRWRFAILSVLRAVRALCGFQISVADVIEQGGSAEAGTSGNAIATLDLSGNSSAPGSGGAAGRTDVPTFRLADFMSHHAVVISADMRQVLDKHRSEYTDEDYAIIERLAEGMTAFQKYTPEVRKKLCYCMQYEVYGPGRVVMKQGHDPKSFYFILKGSAQVYKMENNVRIVLSDLGAGDSFGELALLKGTKRTASVMCTRRSEFFRIDKDDFLDVLKETAEEDIQTKLDFFRTVPFLAGLPLANMTRLAELTSRRELPTNTTIVKEREPLNSVFLIRKGSVRVVRIVPFNKVPRAQRRYSLAPCAMPELGMRGTPPYRAGAELAATGGLAGESSMHPATARTAAASASPAATTTHASLAIVDLASAAAAAAAAAASVAGPSGASSSLAHVLRPRLPPDVVFKLVCRGTLHSGQYFGHECLLASMERRRGTRTAAVDAAVGSPHSVVTCEPTEILRVSRVDMLKLLSPQALAVIEGEALAAATAIARPEGGICGGEADPELRAIQDQYCQARQWIHWKGRVVEELERNKDAGRAEKLAAMRLSRPGAPRSTALARTGPVRAPARGAVRA
ncbi:Cyclic nucleotide-binding domain-containing protein 2 [Allomyces arbusculus]|nr:Cyclic nucleotide-binding domain-containing protein 2 [Allomyces arbusculus]